MIISGSIVAYWITDANKTQREIEEKGITGTLRTKYPLTDEEVDEYVPQYEFDKISSIPSYSEDDTWTFYVYMCGSDLESSFKSELSETSYYDASLYGSTVDSYKGMETYQKIKYLLYENNIDFPEQFYDAVKYYNPTPQAPADDSAPTVKGNASEDLRSITTTPINDKIRFIIQTGGSKKWDYPGINPNRSQRFVYDSNGFYEVYNGPIENMGDEATLRNFLEFGKNFESDHKAFIFWNHGEGAFGAEFDEIFNDRLDLSEIKSAFASVYDLSNNIPPFELLGFDACLMGSSEALYYLQDIAKYYVGSEDIEFGGWNYKEWITKLCENPSANGALLGKFIVDSYIKLSTQQYLYGQKQREIPNILSVYKLENSGSIYEAYTELMKKVLKDIPNNPVILNIVNKASLNSIRLASQNFDSFNTCDLKLFMNNLKEDSVYQEDADIIIKLIDDTVLYKRGRGQNRYSNGLSVYYPTTVLNFTTLLKTFDYIEKVSIDKGLSALYYYRTVGCLNDELKTYMNENNYVIPAPLDSRELFAINNVQINFNEDDSFSLKLPSNSISHLYTTKAITAQYEEDKVTYLYELPINIDYNNDEIVLSSSLIKDNLYLAGERLALSFMNKEDGIIKYKSPILLNNNEETHLIISYNIAENTYSIDGTQDSTLPSDTLARSIKPLKNRDKITPRYYTEEGFYLEGKYVEGKTITYKDNKDYLTVKPLDNGSYITCIEVTDLRGNVYSTPTIRVDLQDYELKNPYLDYSIQIFK